MLNIIYVISNMHLNYNLGICPNGYSSSQKVSPLCECLGAWVLGFDPWVCINLYYMFFLFAYFIFVCI